MSWKIQGLNLLLSEVSGFEKEEEEDDDDDKNREISLKRKLTRRTGSR